jgi:hypothetical protein
MASEFDFIIDGMTWSFSRLESFYNCKAAWKRKYIDCEKDENNAFAEYGSLAHKLLEEWANGDLSAFDLADEYDLRFDDAIQEEFPYSRSGDMRESYYWKGYNYFSEFMDVFDEPVDILGVEREVRFEVEGYPFVGYIDLLVRDANGNVIVTDHKSASLKWLKSGKPAKASVEKMENYKRQLYLYSKALIDDGIQPRELCWNFFNDKKLYRIPFDQNEYEAALKWAVDTIHLIEREEDWEMHDDFWFCGNICGYRNSCAVNERDNLKQDYI